MKRLLALIPAARPHRVRGPGADVLGRPGFNGEEKAVAQKIEDLQTAGERREPEDICANILSRALIQEIETAGANCTQEMEKAIEDADDYDLDVREVTIDGTTATATVRRGEDGPTTTMEFTREGDQWRATSLSGS